MLNMDHGHGLNELTIHEIWKAKGNCNSSPRNSLGDGIGKEIGLGFKASFICLTTILRTSPVSNLSFLEQC